MGPTSAFISRHQKFAPNFCYNCRELFNPFFLLKATTTRFKGWIDTKIVKECVLLETQSISDLEIEGMCSGERGQGMPYKSIPLTPPPSPFLFVCFHLCGDKKQMKSMTGLLWKRGKNPLIRERVNEKMCERLWNASMLWTLCGTCSNEWEWCALSSYFLCDLFIFIFWHYRFHICLDFMTDWIALIRIQE